MLAPANANSMSLIRFDSADAYLTAAAPLIAHDVARSVALRAWIEGVKRASVSERAFMAIWRSAGSLGVAYQRGDQPVIVGDSAAEACVAFADVLAEVHPKLDGVVGKLPACEAFADDARVVMTPESRDRLVDERLATSNALHARLGFEPLEDFYTFDLVEPG